MGADPTRALHHFDSSARCLLFERPCSPNQDVFGLKRSSQRHGNVHRPTRVQLITRNGKVVPSLVGNGSSTTSTSTASLCFTDPTTHPLQVGSSSSSSLCSSTLLATSSVSSLPECCSFSCSPSATGPSELELYFSSCDVEALLANAAFQGKGAFGEVHRVYLTGLPVPVAAADATATNNASIIVKREMVVIVKTLPRSNNSLSQCREEEAACRAAAINTHMPFFFGAQHGPKASWLIFECVCDQPQTLTQYVRNLRVGFGSMKPSEVAAMIKDIACAVAQLHSKGWLHLDLKPDNILVTNRGIFLIDLGFSCPNGKNMGFGSIGSPLYCDPVAVKGCLEGKELVVDAAMDWWSVGMVLLYMLSMGDISLMVQVTSLIKKKYAVEGLSRLEEVQRLLLGKRGITEELLMVLIMLLQYDRSQRQFVAELLEC